MAKSKLLSRSAPFFLALALARPAWATGIRPIDTTAPFFLYVALLGLAGYGVYRRLPPLDRERFVGLAQLVLTVVAAVVVIASFLGAALLLSLPLGYALVRRKHWAGLSLLMTTALLSERLAFALTLLLHAY